MWLDPFYAIVQFPFYRKAQQHSMPKIVAYVVYLGLFFSTAATAALYQKLNPLIHEAVDWTVATMPPLTIADGKVTSPLTAPLLLRYPKDEKIAVVIDTNRTTPVTPQEMQQQKLVAYLTQTALFVYASENKIEQYDFTASKGAKPVTIDAAFFRTLERSLPKIFYPVAWLSAWLIFIAWKLGAGVIYSIAASIMNAAASAGLAYDNLFKISVYAQTPLIALQAVTLFMPQRITGFWLIGLIIVCVYLWQAIRQIHDGEAQEKA